ncbi:MULTISPECIES: hypothetical protein [Burkholderia]|uniref:hypothetical protein n=1 Tax=Burkholderia TaxID=32008 RepID=UPI00075317E2|nr:MULTISPECIES: hypothetical protein [Burkholderia]KVX23526.1 hypothetical protein WL01_08490 [Burkholderia ubonensis]KWB28639.1 hypothetical protein WL33_25705 [Burkholderia ubonensis]KWC24542.1 hypothetical protein WL49_00295 [Burkholderia ubonensis]KWC27530.1 hypothetical protein WL48_27290 [Burkholderia ubonensis]KWC32062.1 hypothetical protein WL50_25050 [Burkholderia ubonensis]
MNSTEQAIADYQGAVKRLFQAAFDQLRVEDPEYYASCSLVLGSGGMVELRSCAMAGGVLETAISVVDAAGEKSGVFRIEIGAYSH